MKSAPVFVLLLLLAASVGIMGNTYTDQDIDEMRSRYERRLPKSRTAPKELLTAPYRPPQLLPFFLPYQDWQEEYRVHFQRLYHDPRVTFRPTMIVMHYTVTPDAQSVWNGFVRGTRMSQGDYGNNFGHPSVQLMVDVDGSVLQLLPLDHRCTGAYGVDHVALSIEMVAMNEPELLSRRKQVLSSFHLVRSLMEKFDIPASRVIAHYEVSAGRSVVPEYTDYADSKVPDRYPPESARTDPGRTYMAWLREYLATLK